MKSFTATKSIFSPQLPMPRCCACVGVNTGAFTPPATAAFLSSQGNLHVSFECLWCGPRPQHDVTAWCHGVLSAAPLRCSNGARSSCHWLPPALCSLHTFPFFPHSFPSIFSTNLKWDDQQGRQLAPQHHSRDSGLKSEILLLPHTLLNLICSPCLFSFPSL